MPNYLAIEFVESRLLVASSKVSARRYQINHLFEIELEEGQSDTEIAQKLKDQLASRGLSRHEWIGVVGRQEAEIREFTVPQAPDNELPDLVRFQARNVFASLNDNWSFDFVPFNTNKDDGRRVLAMAIGPKTRTRLESLAESCGAKLKRITFRPYELCRLFEASLSTTEQHRLLVIPTKDQIEFVVAEGTKVTAARTIQVTQQDDEENKFRQISNEIRRTIASVGPAVESVIYGCDASDWEEFAVPLEEKTGLPFEFSLPLNQLSQSSFTATEIPECPSDYAALIGTLVREASGKRPEVDFLNPRRPAVKKTDYKTILIPLATVALAILGLAAYGWYLLSDQAAIAKKKQDELKQLRLTNAGNSNSGGVERIIKEVDQLDQWYAQKVNWLDELSWISQKMLTPDDILITRFRGVELDRELMIDLNSRMTKARSEDTEWKKLFTERYGPKFGGSEELTDDTEHPVIRPFDLRRTMDIERVRQEIADIAFERKQKSLGSESADADPDQAEPVTD